MSLLTMIQTAAVTIGLQSPTSVVGNTDQNVEQLLAAANIEGQTLARTYNWSVLAKLVSITTIAAEDQGPVTSVLGSDVDRLVSGTAWDRSLIRPLFGPRSPQAWAQDHALVAAGPFYGFRVYDGHLWIFPVPAAGKTMSFEYVSNGWCQSSGGTPQQAWAADTDTGVLDEFLMALGVVVRFKRAKGLEFTEDLIEYQEMLKNRRTTDGGGPGTKSLTGRNSRYPAWPVLPDGNWPTS